MLPSPFRVVLDANVLFPMTLRDVLLRSAERDLFQLYWSATILDEVTRNLVSQSQMTEAQARQLRAAMEGAFPEACVMGFEFLIESMPNHPKDRHVAAVAVKASAQVIVTNNLRDFTALPTGIEAVSPDEFLCDLLDLAPEQMLDIHALQAKSFRRPPRTLEDILHALGKTAPDYVKAVIARLHASGSN